MKGCSRAAELFFQANFLPALLGNLVGGFVFVTLQGSVQAQALRRNEKAL